MANSYLAPDALQSAEKFYPLHAYVCSNCLLVQLLEFESPDAIFGDYQYFSSFSSSWVAHAKRYVEAVIPRFGLGASSLVVEIASNDGYLLQHFVAHDVPVLGIEPAANVAKVAQQHGIETKVAFFGTEEAGRLAAEGKRADLIIGNNVLAHVPDLNDVVAGLAMLVADNGLITMEFPHLLQLIAHSEFDTIYHEHFSYFSLIAVSAAFARHGLRIFDVDELPTHGGSIRIYACRNGNAAKPTTSNIGALLGKESAAGLDDMATYLAFSKRVLLAKRSLWRFFDGAQAAGKTVAAYGAPAKGNTLLNYCGVGTDMIEYTVDRSPYKQGFALPGVHIPIYAPEHIAETKPDYLLILPWNLKDEIMSDMSHIREWGGQFVLPIPEVAIVS